MPKPLLTEAQEARYAKMAETNQVMSDAINHWNQVKARTLDRSPGFSVSFMGIPGTRWDIVKPKEHIESNALTAAAAGFAHGITKAGVTVADVFATLGGSDWDSFAADLSYGRMNEAAQAAAYGNTFFRRALYSGMSSVSQSLTLAAGGAAGGILLGGAFGAAGVGAAGIASASEWTSVLSMATGFGLSSGFDAYDMAISQGKSQRDAISLAFIHGFGEAVPMLVTGGFAKAGLTSMIAKTVSDPLGRVAVTKAAQAATRIGSSKMLAAGSGMAKNLAVELAEEAATEVIQYYGDNHYLGVERDAEDWMMAAADIFASILVSVGTTGSVKGGLGKAGNMLMKTGDEDAISPGGRILAYDVVKHARKHGVDVSLKNAAIVNEISEKQRMKDKFADVDTESEIAAIEILDRIGEVEAAPESDEGRRFRLSPETTAQDIQDARIFLKRNGLSDALVALEQSVNDAAYVDYITENSEVMDDGEQASERGWYRFSTEDSPTFMEWDIRKQQLNIGGKVIEGFQATNGVARAVARINAVKDNITPDQMSKLVDLVESKKHLANGKYLQEFIKQEGLQQTTDAIVKRLDGDSVKQAETLRASMLPVISDIVKRSLVDTPEVARMMHVATDKVGVSNKLLASISESGQKLMRLGTASESTLNPEIIGNVVEAITQEVYKDMTVPTKDSYGRVRNKIRQLKDSDKVNIEAGRVIEQFKAGLDFNMPSTETLYILSRIDESLGNVVRSPQVTAEIRHAMDGWIKTGRYFEEDATPTLDEFFAEHGRRSESAKVNQVNIYERFNRLRSLLGRITQLEQETDALTAEDKRNLNLSISPAYRNAYDDTGNIIANAFAKGRISEKQSNDLYQQLEDMSVNIWEDLTPEAKAEIIENRGKFTSVNAILRKLYITPEDQISYDEGDLKTKYSVGLYNHLNNIIGLISDDPTISQETKDNLFRFDNPDSIAFRSLQAVAKHVVQHGAIEPGLLRKATSDVALLQETLEDYSDTKRLSPVAQSLYDELDRMVVIGRRRPVMRSIRESLKRSSAEDQTFDIDGFIQENITDPIFDITDLSTLTDGSYRLRPYKQMSIPRFAHTEALRQAEKEDVIKSDQTPQDIIDKAVSAFNTVRQVVLATDAPTVDKARTIQMLEVYKDVVVDLYSDPKILKKLVEKSKKSYGISKKQIEAQEAEQKQRDKDRETEDAQMKRIQDQQQHREMLAAMSPEELTRYQLEAQQEIESERPLNAEELSRIERKKAVSRKDIISKAQQKIPVFSKAKQETRDTVDIESAKRGSNILRKGTPPVQKPETDEEVPLISAEALQRGKEFFPSDPAYQKKQLVPAKPEKLYDPDAPMTKAGKIDVVRRYLAGWGGKRAFEIFKNDLINSNSHFDKQLLHYMIKRDASGLERFAKPFERFRFSADEVKRALEAPFTSVSVTNMLNMMDYFGLEIDYVKSDTLKVGDVDPTAKDPDRLVRAYVNLENGKITVTNRATVGDIAHEIGHWVAEGLALPKDMQQVLIDHFGSLNSEALANAFALYLQGAKTDARVPGNVQKAFNFIRQQLLRLFNFLSSDMVPIRKMTPNDLFEMALNGSLNRYGVKGLGASESRGKRFSLLPSSVFKDPVMMKEANAIMQEYTQAYNRQAESLKKRAEADKKGGKVVSPTTISPREYGNFNINKKGWHVGKDGILRKEFYVDGNAVVDVIDTTIKPDMHGTYLRDIAHAVSMRTGDNTLNNIISLVPELGDLAIFTSHELKEVPRDVAGYFNPDTNSIAIRAGRAKRLTANTVMHEIQHAIQHFTGLPGGLGHQALVNEIKNNDLKLNDDLTYALYLSLYGEIEARTVGRRAAGERTAIWADEDAEDFKAKVALDDAMHELKDYTGEPLGLDERDMLKTSYLAIVLNAEARTAAGMKQDVGNFRFSAEDPQTAAVNDIEKMLSLLPEEAWGTLIKDYVQVAIDQHAKDGVKVTPHMVYEKLKATSKASGERFMNLWPGLHEFGDGKADELLRAISERALNMHEEDQSRKEAMKPLEDARKQLKSYVTKTITALRRGTGDVNYNQITDAAVRMTERKFGKITENLNLSQQQVRDLISFATPGAPEGEQSVKNLTEKLVSAQIEVVKAREVGKIITMLREIVGDDKLSGFDIRTAVEMYEQDWNVKKIDIVHRVLEQLHPRPRAEVMNDLREVSQEIKSGVHTKSDMVALKLAQTVLREQLSKTRATESYDQRALQGDSARGTVEKLKYVVDKIKSGYGNLLSIRYAAKKLGIPEFGDKLVAFGSNAQNLMERLQAPMPMYARALRDAKEALKMPQSDNTLGWASLFAYEGDPRFFQSKYWKDLSPEMQNAALSLKPHLAAFYSETPNDPRMGARTITQQEIKYDIDQVMHRRNQLIAEYRRTLKGLKDGKQKNLLAQIEDYEQQLRVLSDPDFHYVNIPKSFMGNKKMDTVDFETRQALSVWQVYEHSTETLDRPLDITKLNPIDVMGEYAMKMARKIAIADISEWIKSAGLAVPIPANTKRPADGYVLGSKIHTTLQGFAVEENIAKLFRQNIIEDGVMPKTLQHIFNTVKLSNFVTPFVIGMNDIKQGLIARVTPGSYVKEAWQKLNDPFDPDTVAFSKSSAKSTPSLNYEQSNMAIRKLKNNDSTLWHFIKRAGMVEPAVQALRGDVTGGLRTLIGDNPVVALYQGSHHLAWQSDEVLRFAAWLNMRKRGMTEAEAGREVARVFADYGDIPKNTRSVMGILGFTPNYRVNMVKMFSSNAMSTAKFIHNVAVGKSSSVAVKTGMLNMATHIMLVGMIDLLMTQGLKFERDDDDKWWKSLVNAGLRYKKNVYVPGQGRKEGVVKLGGPLSSIQREVDLITRPFGATHVGDVPTEMYRGALTMAHPIYRVIGQVMTGEDEKGNRIWNVADPPAKQFVDRSAHVLTTMVPMLDLFFGDNPGFAEPEAREALLGHWANVTRGVLDYEAMPYLRDVEQIRKAKRAQFEVRRFIEDAKKMVRSGRRIPPSWRQFRPTVD